MNVRTPPSTSPTNVPTSNVYKIYELVHNIDEVGEEVVSRGCINGYHYTIIKYRMHISSSISGGTPIAESNPKRPRSDSSSGEHEPRYKTLCHRTTFQHTDLV